jgi:hypothetical protein
MSDNEQKQVNIEDMNAQQSLEALWTLMNKAATKGSFNIDESYVLKILFSKVSKHIVNTSQSTQHIVDSTEPKKHILSGVFNKEV